MISIALCDDMAEHLQRSMTLTQQYMRDEGEECSFRKFSSAEELRTEIEEGYFPDLAVLDIEMPGTDGITLARQLNTMIPECRIIFLTSYLDYAQESYRAEHIWFTVKKDAEKYLPEALKKALNSIRNNDAVQCIVIRNNSQKIPVDINEIYYISKVGRKSMCHCADRNLFDTRRPALLIPPNLASRFIRCHQGYWVNKDMIAELDKNEFVLKDKTRIPISRSYRDSARNEFFRRFGIM